MNASTGVTPSMIGLFAFIIISQIAAVATLPRTEAFNNLTWTAICLAIYLVSIWSIAAIIHSGAPISVLIPLMSAVIPLATIAVGVIVYGESASLLKLGLLCSACAVIGVAAATR